MFLYVWLHITLHLLTQLKVTDSGTLKVSGDHLKIFIHSSENWHSMIDFGLSRYSNVTVEGVNATTLFYIAKSNYGPLK